MVSTSPSLTRVNHRSNVDPGPPKADFRLEMINRFLLSGDQTGLKSAAGVVATARNAGPVSVHHEDVLVAFACLGNRRRKAIWVPSGDQAGSASTPVRGVGQRLRLPGSDDRQACKARHRPDRACRSPSRARSDRPARCPQSPTTFLPASSRRINLPSIPTTSKPTLFLLNWQLINITLGSVRLHEACATLSHPAGSRLKSFRSPEPSAAITRSTPAFA